MRITSRRSFLRGAGGAMLGLPWLESAAPAATRRSKQQSQPPQRLGFFYVPIGVVRRAFFPGEGQAGLPAFNGDFSAIIETTTQVGSHPIKLTPTLEPLANIKQKVALVTGLDRTFQIGTDVHAQCASCFLSSAAPFTVTRSAWPLERTLDHVVADQIGQTTPFSTLEFSCNSHQDNQESMYFDNISWYGTGHVAPSIRDPRKAYRRLFGTQEVEQARNVTDLVLEDARSLQRELGHADRDKFAEYFESIRTIENQMDRFERLKDELLEVSIPEPPEAYLPRGAYIRLMCDLIAVAFQAGLTRVASLMVAPERWNTPFMFEGLFDKPISHHLISHQQQEYGDELEQIDRFHVAQFAYLLERLDSIQEADGSTLLDNTVFTYGSGLGDGATHQYNDLPIIVAGSGSGKFKLGQHLHCAEGTPLANLWLSQAQVMGLGLDRYADSTGLVPQLFA